jgi:hypothetical protein
MSVKKAILIFLTTLFIFGCQVKSPLKNHDFKNGKWLLVKEDFAKNTLQVIDDEKILNKFYSTIKIIWNDDDDYTTCDGTIKLYKNGELIVKQNYLDASKIIESSNIKSSYKIATDTTIESYNKNEFLKQFDSLKSIKNSYPTRYHEQPADKDIIWLYKYE